jgi:hypothetical protein
MGRSVVAMSEVAAAQQGYELGLARLVPLPLRTLLVGAARHEIRRLVHNPFEQFGNEFRVEDEGGVFHVEARRDGIGRVVAEVRQEVRYDVGANVHGHSYLVERDGGLYQSPISWYRRTERWNVSPGFTPDQHFDRVIREECLFCHCNHADAVEHALNRYRPPVFHGTAIGCERCHGPGELHVRAREAGLVVAGKVDDTIVNPKHLEPALREAVCQQCHLEGVVRVLRRGRRWFDFRPGLPLQLVATVFVKRPGLADAMLSVSHVEQMVMSRCYTGSGGHLGCSSCHDPHALPAESARVAYYRDRCRQCHGGSRADCSLSLAERRRNGDDCTACHMPRAANQDVPHSVATDHRVLRRPTPEDAAPGTAVAALRPGELPIVAFHRDLPGPGERELKRDLGLALAALARRFPPVAALSSSRAQPLLDEAVYAWPDDVDALESRVFVLIAQDRKEEALEAAEAVLARAPEREQTLADATWLCRMLGRPADALTYCRRALAVAPGSTRYQAEEAGLLLQLGDWDAAIASARRAVRLNALLPEPHAVLAAAYLATGRKKAAAAELEVLAVVDPARAEEFRRQVGDPRR